MADKNFAAVIMDYADQTISISQDIEHGEFIDVAHDTDREFSANFDRQASATDSVLFLGLSPPKAHKTVSFFVSFHRGATQSRILFLVLIEPLDQPHPNG